jgi:hypothetical protein
MRVLFSSRGEAMTERERKRRFKLALKWAREAWADHQQKRTDKSLGGLCIAAMAVWARAHDHDSCALMADLFRDVCLEIGEEVE